MSLQLPIFGPLSPAVAQAGERRDWAAPGLSWPSWDSGTEQGHGIALLGTGLKGSHLLPFTSQLLHRLLASAQGFLTLLPSLWHWGSSFPSLARSHLSCCPAWSIPRDSCAQVSSAEHRSPHPGLWKIPLTTRFHNISQDFFPRGQETFSTEQ